MRSRVSPFAGGTNNREGGDVDSDSDLSTGSKSGLELLAGVPRCDDGRDLPTVKFPFPGGRGGGVNLSIVNVKKSSCCSFKCFRVVSRMVEIVRNDH